MGKRRRKKGDTRNFSLLEEHVRDRKILVSPFKTLKNLTPRSWINDRLPDVLWAALLTNSLPRDQYLAIFRSISEGAENFRDTKTFITHSKIEKISNEDFGKIFAPMLSDEITKQLAPLRLFPDLPDIEKWSRYLPEPDSKEAWQKLATTVANCLDHQSEASTDLRWLKVRFQIIQHRIRFPTEMAHLAREILMFPDEGDLRAVRPSIRAMEIGLNGLDEAPPVWPAIFWKHCFEHTECSLAIDALPESEFPHEEMNQTWGEAYAECCKHFMATISTTAIDARHDGAFGLALYGLTLVASLFRPYSTRPAGRIVLRALVETYLTLAFLVKKDQPALWAAYREYGGGQTKLAFLKLVKENDLPRYVDINTLSSLANEDMWQEMVNIDLGHWAGKDLRKMSEDVGIKDVYDKYYTWPSSFVHGQWPAARNTAFALCINPLHRLHRVPRPPRLDLEDVSWDGVRLGNLLLDLINQAYPTFKSRLRPPTPKK